MALRKFGWYRLRTRSQLRAVVLLTCCLMASLLLLNRTLLVDRATPQDLANIGPNSPPAPSTTTKLPALNEELSELKGPFGTYREEPENNESLTSGVRENPKTLRAKNDNEPSFGFTNENVRPPLHEGNQYMDGLKSFFKGESAVNPGMLLGAVAALNGAKSLMANGEGSPLKSVLDFARGSKHSIFAKNEASLPESQDFLKQKYREPENEPPVMSAQRNTPLNERGVRINEAESTKHVDSNQGLSKSSKTLARERANRGLLAKSSTQDALSSVLTRLVPPLLAGAFSNDLPASKPDSSNPFHSLLGGVGPILLAGVMQRGFGKENSERSTGSSPFQSIMSQMGPSLLAGAVQAGLGTRRDEKEMADGKGSNPMSSILSGLGSALMASLAQNGKDSKKESIKATQRLRERPKRMRSYGDSYALRPNSVEPLSERKPGAEGGRGHQDSSVSGLETLVTSTVKAVRAMDVVTERVSDYPQNASEDQPKLTDDVSEDKGGVARFLTRAVLQALLPEEITVPEANSTNGAWDMAVNLVLGNPKDGEGKESQFWKWLRLHGGVAEGAEPQVPSWITKALDTNPERRSYVNEIKTLYQFFEVQEESLCKRVKYVGGMFNWKTNILDGSRAVCMDPDVAPKRKECVVYSFGIREKWSFEEEMEKMECEIWAFDPSVKLGNHNHSANIHFYSLGLAASNTTKKVDQQVWNLFTLSAVMGKLGHETRSIDYLKLDIHGDEWEVLKEAMLHSRQALTNVLQLGVEVHLERALGDPSLYEDYLETLKGLESFGFQLFASRESQKPEKKYEDPVLKRRVSLSYDLAFIRI